MQICQGVKTKASLRNRQRRTSRGHGQDNSVSRGSLDAVLEQKRDIRLKKKNPRKSESRVGLGL